MLLCNIERFRSEGNPDSYRGFVEFFGERHVCKSWVQCPVKAMRAALTLGGKMADQMPLFALDAKSVAPEEVPV